MARFKFVALLPYALSTLSLAPFHAAAQTTSGALPGSLEAQARKPVLPQSRPQAPFKLDRPSTGQVASAVVFEVTRVEVDGAAGLSPAELAALTGPLAHRTVALSELMALADRISALYARKGYALSFALVPEQTVTDGVVHLSVVEGTVDQIAVEFKGKLSARQQARIAEVVQRRLRGLVHSGPVRTYDLESAVLGIDGLSGITPSVIVRPSRSIEAAADLLVVVEAKGLEVELSADNRLRREFGAEQAVLSAALNGVAVIGDRVDLSHRRSREPGAYEHMSLGYSAPVGDTAGRAYVAASRSRTRAVSGFLSSLEFTGREETARIGLQMPLYDTRARSLMAHLELAALDTQSSLFGATLIKDRVRTLEAGLSYDWADRTGASSLLDVGYTKGLKGLAATDADNPLRSRAYGSAAASYMSLRFYRNQPVLGLNLALDVQGQVVTRGQSLWATAECAYGGQAYGRGFDTGQLGGDSCLKGTLELSRRFRVAKLALEPYGFVDGARVGQNGPLEYGEVREATASSKGLGLRLSTDHGLSLDVQYSRPQERATSALPKDGRWFFTLGYSH